jgi:integrase
LEDVSKLLGHSSIAVTEKYYAPWVASRKLRLERLLSDTLANTKSH